MEDTQLKHYQVIPTYSVYLLLLIRLCLTKDLLCLQSKDVNESNKNLTTTVN